MHQGQRTPDLPVAQRAEPTPPCGAVTFDPRANRLDHEDIRQPRDHRVATGSRFPRFGGSGDYLGATGTVLVDPSDDFTLWTRTLEVSVPGDA